jgi:hypothetical protein
MSFVIKKMQRRIAMKFHFTPVRMDIIKNQINAGGDVKERESHILLGYINAVTIGNSREVPQELKVELYNQLSHSGYIYTYIWRR